MQFIDIYILIKDIDEKKVKYFLTKYLNGFEQASSYYEYPEYSDNPEYETENVSEMLNYLLKNTTKEYTLYWNNPVKSEIINGMIFFTNDSCLILGLSVKLDKEKFFVEKLKKDFNSSFSLSIYEELPPLNSTDFIKLASTLV